MPEEEAAGVAVTAEGVIVVAGAVPATMMFWSASTATASAAESSAARPGIAVQSASMRGQPGSTWRSGPTRQTTIWLSRTPAATKPSARTATL
ncbi:MAG: hypothetical protein IPO88_00710 [Nannocystis sp.]|uniref:hypothetical protein n=1 Tax=Nannocystis sp. TaxID=1962667 RepID=UPI0024292F7F|nr:hypothetical protein [Nannocystis sp.]MBK9752024.1 hypothetical protein [Nannocystis sp.]